MTQEELLDLGKTDRNTVAASKGNGAPLHPNCDGIEGVEGRRPPYEHPANPKERPMLGLILFAAFASIFIADRAGWDI